MAMKWDDLEPAPNEVPATSEKTPTSVASADSPKWDDLVESPDQISHKSAATDIVHDIGIGTMQLPSAITGLADIPAGLAGYDRPFSKAAEQLGEATGFQPGKWAEEAEKSVYSPERQAAEKRVSKAWDEYEQGKGGILGAIGATLAEPRVLAGTVAKSAPSMAGGMGIARGAKLLAPSLSPVVAGAAGEGAISAGQQMDQSAEGVDPQRRAIASGLTGLGVGAVGYGAGKVSGKLGFTDIETAAAGGELAEGVSALPAYKRIPGGMVSEGLLEEAPQSALEQASQNIAEGRDVSEGMGRAVTQGALAGGVMGGVSNILPSAQPDATPQPEIETEQPATEATQPATSELDLRTDAEKAVKPIDLTTPTEDFGEVDQPTEQPPINVPPGGFDIKETEDWLDRFERAWAGTPNGAPRKPTVSLATEAYKLGINVAQDDDPKAVIAAMRAEIEARKSPEQKIAEAAQNAKDKIKRGILDQTGGDLGVTSKAAFDTIDAGLPPDVQDAIRAKEQELAAQQEPVIELPADVDPKTGEILSAEVPIPIGGIDTAALSKLDDSTLQDWIGRSDNMPEFQDVVRTILANRAAAVKPQEEVSDASKIREDQGQPVEARQIGEGVQVDSSGDVYQPVEEQEPSSETIAAGQSEGNIPTAEEVITQPRPTKVEDVESEDQTTQATPQEVTTELDAAVADQAAANANPADYVPTDSFEAAAAVTLSEQSDKAPEDIAEGNYKKGEVAYKGLRVAIETPAGESRINKKDPANPYPPLADHYGEIVGADATDGDFVDAFSNPDEAAREASKQVFIVDQIRPTQEGVAIDKTDPRTWEYDEAKVMLGYGSKAEAEKAYLRNYEPGWQGLGEISTMSLPNFKRWLVSGKTKEPVAKKVAAPKMESAPKVPVFKVPLRGKVSEPDKLVYQKVADRLGIPTSVVADIDRLSASELQSRNQEGIYPLKAARISEYGGDLRDRYVEYVRRFNPEELTTSEAEDGIKTRQGSNYPQYLAWAKKGVKPPLISVAETESGALQSSSRRRTLAAQEAGKPISGWFSPINRETTYKDPLKYGDILDAIQDVKDDTRTKTVQKTDDLLTAIAKLGGIARKHAEGVDPAAFKDAKAKGDITPVFRITGGRSLDDLMLVLNTEYGWAFADPNDLGMAVTDALRSGEPTYNAEGSVRQAKKQLDEYKSDDQLQAENDFIAEVDASSLLQERKDAWRKTVAENGVSEDDYDILREEIALSEMEDIPAFSRRVAPGQTDLFAATKEEMAELNAKQGVSDYAAQKDKRRQGNGAEPPPLFSDYPGFMGQVDIEDKEQSLPDLFQSLGKFDKAPESINHPDAERIRYVQDNFLDLLSELESNNKVEIKC